jgi:toxin CcdB
MPQFAVYRNPNPDTRSAYPLLLDVQSDLIESLATRVVVPLSPAAAMKGRRLGTLTPALDIGGRQYVMLTPQLAGVAVKSLGPRVGDCAARRQEILAALDLLLTGI